MKCDHRTLRSARSSLRGSLLLILLMLLHTPAGADEGMYPLTGLDRLNLAGAGLQLDAAQIYNPDGVSLVDAIVKVGGCSGSFVSGRGLILTNHHCVFGAVAGASTPEHDFLEKGFLAASMEEEIRAEGMTVRITRSYRDVTSEIRAIADTIADPVRRSRAASRKMKEISTAAERAHPGTDASVSEMSPGRRYVLFEYDLIRDVRLVYVPPRSIGEFGGEEENWRWPRHTGDFSFVRAYVAPDGTPAEYSPVNIPYTSRRVLKIQPAGAAVEEPVFLLGYPARTYRHRTSSFLAYEEQVRMPYVRDWYAYQIQAMKDMSATDPSAALTLAPRIKSLSNTMKNYSGKLHGLHRLDLVGRWRREEHQLQQFILADEDRKREYATVLDEIRALYQETEYAAPYDFTLEYLRSSVPLDLAVALYEAAFEIQKPDLDRMSAYMESNRDATLQSLILKLHRYQADADSTILREMLLRASKLPVDARIYPLDALAARPDAADTIGAFIHLAFGRTIVLNESTLIRLFGMPPEKLDSLRDPLLDVAAVLYPLYQSGRQTDQERNAKLTELRARLLEVKQQYSGDRFIPDANRTLRLTYGRVRGYSPADGLVALPRTTVRGLIDKSTGSAPFNTPSDVKRLWQQRMFGSFADPALQDVPVCVLYNLDTSGGNSGSAVLNARGELVGLNFDRTYDATINDFAWSEEYSRSIGVDIRYILWMTGVVSGAGHLLQEMGLSR
jgi:hypothetical protein